MSLPTFCPNCRKVVSVADASGSCPSCGHAINTPRRSDTSAGTTDPHATATFAVNSFATATSAGVAPSALSVVPDIPNHTDFEVIGRGGMGTVYRAIQRPIDRTVAVKVVNYPAADLSLRERFVKEVKAHARVQHAGLLAIYDVGECSHGPFFTMEYHHGGNLSDRLRASELPVEEAVRIVADAADAVQAAHDADILHRDLKPSNILLGRDGRVKVTDFGLAKHAGDPTLTHTEAFLGTVPYMSPEQASGKVRRVNERSDVYGLGATLYQTLTGRPPHEYQGFSPRAAMRAIQRNPTPSPRAKRPELCETLDAIVTKAMAGRPAERYISAAALAADLRRWLAKEPTEAKPWTRAKLARRWLRRRAAILATLLTAVLLVGVAVIAVREFDPKLQLERELAHVAINGGRVELLDPAGRPRIGEEWVIGDAGRLTDVSGEGSLGFQTQTLSLLKLLDDPGMDRFELTLGLRHHGQDSGTESYVGFYLGHDVGRTDAGRQFHRSAVFRYCDFYRADEVAEPRRRKDHRAYLEWRWLGATSNGWATVQAARRRGHRRAGGGLSVQPHRQ